MQSALAGVESTNVFITKIPANKTGNINCLFFVVNPLN